MQPETANSLAGAPVKDKEHVVQSQLEPRQFLTNRSKRTNQPEQAYHQGNTAWFLQKERNKTTGTVAIAVVSAGAAISSVIIENNTHTVADAVAIAMPSETANKTILPAQPDCKQKK